MSLVLLFSLTMCGSCSSSKGAKDAGIQSAQIIDECFGKVYVHIFGRSLTQIVRPTVTCQLLTERLFTLIVIPFIYVDRIGIFLLHRHALILDRLLTFLMTFFTLVLKPSFSQSLSLHSHLSFSQAYLTDF